MPEHDDHPTYICSVIVERTGDLGDMVWQDGHGNRIPMTHAEIEWNRVQEHALIYTDGTVAVTMYEYCYAMWYVKDGGLGGGSLWAKSKWKLSDDTLRKIREIAGK